MQANYSDQPLHHPTPGQSAIFLAGPTPRFDEASQQLISASWRPEAVRIFAALGYDGIVYAPENHDASPQRELDLLKQARWEWEALDAATVVLFWVPRVIDRSLPTLGMPAFTTNVEFGLHIGKNPAKVVYGHPEGAPKTRYLDALYTEHTGRQPSTTLEETITQAIACAKALQTQDN